ncbi:MAG: hypothetical protein AAFW81_05910 [Pseudomonadota bacterium]
MTSQTYAGGLSVTDGAGAVVEQFSYSPYGVSGAEGSNGARGPV